MPGYTTTSRPDGPGDSTISFVHSLRGVGAEAIAVVVIGGGGDGAVLVCWWFRRWCTVGGVDVGGVDVGVALLVPISRPSSHPTASSLTCYR